MCYFVGFTLCLTYTIEDILEEVSLVSAISTEKKEEEGNIKEGSRGWGESRESLNAGRHLMWRLWLTLGSLRAWEECRCRVLRRSVAHGEMGRAGRRGPWAAVRREEVARSRQTAKIPSVRTNLPAVWLAPAAGIRAVFPELASNYCGPSQCLGPVLLFSSLHRF